MLSQANIENFSTRSKILLQSTLRLRYGTSARQLRAILDQLHDLLTTHPELDIESARVRVIDFAAQAIEIELFTYVMTADMTRFMSVREDLLLAAATIVEAEGSAFAGPTDVVNLRSGASRPRMVSSSS